MTDTPDPTRTPPELLLDRLAESGDRLGVPRPDLSGLAVAAVPHAHQERS